MICFKPFPSATLSVTPEPVAIAIAGKGHSYKTPVKEEAAVIKTL